eukprot:3499863-Prymnesium_polylepis.1
MLQRRASHRARHPSRTCTRFDPHPHTHIARTSLGTRQRPHAQPGARVPGMSLSSPRRDTPLALSAHCIPSPNMSRRSLRAYGGQCSR